MIVPISYDHFFYGHTKAHLMIAGLRWRAHQDSRRRGRQPESSTMWLQNFYPGCRWRSVVQQRPAPGLTWRRSCPDPTDRH